MSIPDGELVEIFAELTEKYGIRATTEGEFTTRMYAQQHSVSWERADKIVKRAMRDGILESIGKRRGSDGIVGEAYRRIKTADA